MNQADFKEFLKRIQSETLYFKNEFEEAVIKSVPNKGCFVKFKGKEEFKAEQGSAVVADGVGPQTEITEEEYNSF